MFAPISFVYPLDDFFAPLMFEIHIDIGRLAAFLADEALEQQTLPNGIDRGNAETVEHRRMGGGAAALSEDALRAGKADDRFDGQKVWGILQPLDQIEFVPDLRGDIVGKAVRITARGPFPNQFFQTFLRRQP